MKKIFYAWIPNLSGDIFFVNIYDSLEKNKYKILRDCHYSKKINMSDFSNSRLYDIEIEICGNYCNQENNKKIFIDITQLDIKVICVIEINGLLKLEVDYGEKRNVRNKIDLGVARQIYWELKNIYHEHTHHSDEEDHLLDVVETDFREEAIKKIVLMYKKKIFNYHHFLKKYLSESNVIDYARQHLKLTKYFLLDIVKKNVDVPIVPIGLPYVNLAQGEMLYAIHFIVIFKNVLGEKDYSDLDFIYNNAYRSFEGIEKKMCVTLQEYANTIILCMTFVIIVLTIVIFVCEIL